jgi:hypothetical protein
MGYTDFSEENFSSRSFPNVRLSEWELAVEGMRKRWVAHEVSLSQVLIFRNVLSSGPSPPRRHKAKDGSL